MASPTTAAAPTPEALSSPAEGTWVVDRQRVRRPLGALFWFAALVLPLGLTAAVALSRGPAIERSVHAEAMAALHRAHIKGVRVVVEGRQVVAKVPTGAPLARVQATLLAVPGIETVRTVSVYASKAEARACAGLQGKIDRATDRQEIPFVGASTRVSATGSRMLRTVARLLLACPPATVIVGGHADSHTPHGSTISLLRAQAMVRALRQQGVASARLLPRGYGDQFPLTDGSSVAAQARNQRGSIAVEDQ